MPQTIQIQQYGGPEQMRLVDLPVGEPGPGEIRIRHHAIGLNFIDVYQRTGLYQNPLPLKLGKEGAGVVEAVGEGVSHLKLGDRAAYASQPPGAYCEARVMPGRMVPERGGVIRLPSSKAKNRFMPPSSSIHLCSAASRKTRRSGTRSGKRPCRSMCARRPT